MLEFANRVYSIQRYEGASTLYGPHTLAAYIERTLSLLPLLKSGSHAENIVRERGPLPPDNSDRSISFIAGVWFDGKPRSRQFGDTLVDVSKTHLTRGENATATFIGANPRNNLRLEQTFAAVEYRRSGGTKWETVRDDSDWGLIFRWRRMSRLLGTSEVEITWEIEDWAPPGEYRLKYYGDAKQLLDKKMMAFEGTSRTFYVN